MTQKEFDELFFEAMRRYKEKQQDKDEQPAAVIRHVNITSESAVQMYQWMYGVIHSFLDVNAPLRELEDYVIQAIPIMMEACPEDAEELFAPLNKDPQQSPPATDQHNESTQAGGGDVRPLTKDPQQSPPATDQHNESTQAGGRKVEIQNEGTPANKSVGRPDRNEVIDLLAHLEQVRDQIKADFEIADTLTDEQIALRTAHHEDMHAYVGRLLGLIDAL